MTTQTDCPPVHHEIASFDGTTDTTLLQNPAFRGFVDSVASNLVVAHARHRDDVENGQAATRAIQYLGCESCAQAGVCGVEDSLRQQMESGAKDAEIINNAAMLSSAPRWLRVARLHMSGKTPEDVAAHTVDIETTAESLRTGKLNLGEMLGGTKNEIIGRYDKRDLPELDKLKTSDKAQLYAHLVTTKSGLQYSVIDASDQTSGQFTGEALKEYGILCVKLLERMTEQDKNGSPHIFQADQTMQKQIEQLGNATLYEMRMGNKNRMYFTVMRSLDDSDGPIARVVIVGAHGGNEHTQQHFINNLLAKA